MLTIKTLKLSDLKPAPYNPREATEKQSEDLRKSLSKFGLVEPIIYNENTGNIVGGHFRVRELTTLGKDEADCVIVNLSLEDEKELNIRLNANTGKWDYDVLANEWDTASLVDWGLDLPEFDIDPDCLSDEFSLPDGDKEPFQQMTFTLADAQAEFIKEKLKDAKAFACETYGNENSNGNALYLMVVEWAEQKTL
jgi:hypothetical protein